MVCGNCHRVERLFKRYQTSVSGSSPGPEGVIEGGKEGKGMLLILRGTHLAYGMEGGLEARRPGGSLVWSSR